MLDNLRTGLRGAIKKIVRASDINEELIDSLCKDIQRAPLQADVNVKLVLEITKRIKERSMNEEPVKGLTRKDHIITILYGELARLLGYSGQTIKNIDKSQQTAEKIINFEPNKQSIILMLGIQGSGKTTVTAKIARWLSKQGYSAAAIGGIIVTKLDGTAKGGGVLAASAATGARVMFIGTGERIDDLEVFSPTSFVGRILGMGDIQAILEMARGLELQADENQAKRLLSGKMTIEDFYAQMENVGKMGFRNVIDNLPGLSGMLKEDQLDVLEGKMEKWRFIIQSMTKYEKRNPEIINESRRKRIARGSGLTEHEVKDLVKQYSNSKTMMKQAKGRQMQGMLRKFGIG